jgi:hypothetical protein
MTMRNSLAAAIAAAAVVVFLAVGTAKAGIVVYGNLGSSGTNAISSSGGIVLTATTWRAIGFTVGGTNVMLETVTIGFNVGSSGSADVRLDLYSNSSGQPGTSLFNTSQSLAANTLNQPITFNFNQTLSSGSTYWIVAQRAGGTGNATALAWRPAAGTPNPAPITQNASGWLNLGNATGVTSADSGATWGSTGTGSSNSISFTAIVPEPSTWAMGGVGITFAASCREFQRRRRVNARES